jgi:hypothetical protein
VSDVSDDFAVSLLDDSGAEIARVAAHDLQPTKGLLLLAADERRRRAGGPAVTIRFCAHFLRDGLCKRRHRCRFAHFAPPTAVAAGSQDTSPHHRAADSSASSQQPPPPPLAAAASRSGANSAVPSHGGGSRLYSRRGWSHAAYAAVPSRV